MRSADVVALDRADDGRARAAGRRGEARGATDRRRHPQRPPSRRPSASWRSPARGDQGDPRAHLRHDQRPQPEEEHRYGRLVEFWSAISAGALLIFIVATLYLSLLGPAAAVVVAIAGYVAIEAASRRRLIETLLRATLVLAVVGADVLVVTNLPLILVAVIAGIALLAIIDNLRELRT